MIFLKYQLKEFHKVTLFRCGSLLLHLLATRVSHKFAKLRGVAVSRKMLEMKEIEIESMM